MRLTLIAAVARNGVIGNDNRLLWQLSEDMRFFKQTTLGHAVVMGRKTWQSLPPRFRPLPGRRNLVVTRNPAFEAPGAECVASLDAALQRLTLDDEVFVIGGAELYALALPRAQRLLLTEVDRDFDGDARFPPWPRADFSEASRTQHDSGQGFGYQRADYRRRHGG
ncbi:MAG TPA: dihydrofolate reductase [Rubrivivax sp.]|nr:dihydrofolate reductase [Rubrivivax sp.]